MSDLEKHTLAIEEESSLEESLKLDRHGLPLVPQPSDDPNDPLNWPYRKKIMILVIMTTMAFFASISLAFMNPAYAQVGIALHKTAVQASYIGTSSIAGAGVACFLWSPLANVYGRRPILLFAQSLAVVAGFGSSFAKSYNGVLVCRVFAGLGHGASFVLTALVMSDVFYLHERGKMIGIATVALVNGSHAAALPGGYVASFISWRWTLILPSIIASACLFMLLVGYPETLYLRGVGIEPPKGRNTYLAERRLWGFKSPHRHLRLVDFARPIQMLRYPPILAVGLYSAVCLTLGSVMPAQTASALFHTYYGWNSAHTGVALAVSTTVGGVLGEIVAGPVTDKLMRSARKRANGAVKPESRLHAMWSGFILMPIGLVIFGAMIRFHSVKNSWVGACIAMGVTSFAVQVVITTGIAYVVDCYKPQASHSIQLLNFMRQTMGFTVGFWSIPFGTRVGFQFSGLTYALVSLLSFIPVGIMMRYGERIRMKAGKPTFDVEI